MVDLLKDIICFANTVHDENCYIIFGISDSLQILGMQKKRIKQAEILDAISNLTFAGDVSPKIEVKTIVLDGQVLDVLIIFNVERTPIYLKKNYGTMRGGCIYTRVGDKNTPDNGNADIGEIEDLWRKRFGLTKPPLEFIYDRMNNKFEWIEQNEGFYNIYRPEYTIQIQSKNDEARDEPMYYSYAMVNSQTSFEVLNIKYQNIILESYGLIILDSGRLRIPIPDQGFVCHKGYEICPKYSYEYYILGSKLYKILSFLYEPQNGDEHSAFERLKEVILIYYSEEEKLAFESFIEGNQDLPEKYIGRINRFNYMKTNDEKIKFYLERLKIGVALNILLTDWRNKKL
ncbi:helix-turn-helix domain-containing protein [Christensenella sp. MSJ-20]|uniref:helix-turn-helix domain-containing protein n=1 Tax=Christensenella sp. MSJ-20 TaxID=2841518 RepID=UPI0037C03649